MIAASRQLDIRQAWIMPTTTLHFLGSILMGQAAAVIKK